MPRGMRVSAAGAVAGTTSSPAAAAAMARYRLVEQDVYAQLQARERSVFGDSFDAGSGDGSR